MDNSTCEKVTLPVDSNGGLIIDGGAVGSNNLIIDSGSTFYTANKPKWRDITIQRKDNGFVVLVGCKTLVFNSRESLFKAMRDYFDDPELARKKYIREKV